MVVGWKTILLASVVSWSVGWLFNSPVPPGFHDPWALRVSTAPHKVRRLVECMKRIVLNEKDIFVAMRNYDSVEKSSTNLPVKTEDLTFDGVKVRLYRPVGLMAMNNPAIVFYHGGGWISSTIDHYDAYTLTLAHEVQSLVLSVEYRLAPENPYPAGLTDCVTATKYFLHRTEQFRVDPARVAIAGDSAGGNLAAATALVLRDQQVTPQPKLQVLIYPLTQAINFQSPSYRANFNNPLLPARHTAGAWVLYANISTDYIPRLLSNQHTSKAAKKNLYAKQLNLSTILKHPENAALLRNVEDFGDENLWAELKPILMDPYMAPLMAGNVSGLPEALIFTVEADVLRDDGLWYAEHLRSAGITVTHRHYLAGFHGIMSSVNNMTNNIEARGIIYELLREYL